MIKRFKTKLRLAGLEDMLQYELGLQQGMASWLARLACDVAGQNGVDLLELRGEARKQQFFRQMAVSGHNDTLQRAAATSERFAAHLPQEPQESFQVFAQAA